LKIKKALSVNPPPFLALSQYPIVFHAAGDRSQIPGDHFHTSKIVFHADKIVFKTYGDRFQTPGFNFQASGIVFQIEGIVLFHEKEGFQKPSLRKIPSSHIAHLSGSL
jgi:hypothetical protein